jgi:hypothetical protein
MRPSWTRKTVNSNAYGCRNFSDVGARRIAGTWCSRRRFTWTTAHVVIAGRWVREAHTNTWTYAFPLLSALRGFEGSTGALGRDICDVSRLFDHYSTVESIWTLILNASAFSKTLLTSTKLRGVLLHIKVTVFTQCLSVTYTSCLISNRVENNC